MSNIIDFTAIRKERMEAEQKLMERVEYAVWLGEFPAASFKWDNGEREK